MLKLKADYSDFLGMPFIINLWINQWIKKKKKAVRFFDSKGHLEFF